ncbi:hypothetical protein [Saccharothrix deserti]|uniref:hypothetical protein n=1 Tax=Saccharothrix deserti TaxID=2593674 RepID=UPI00131EB235|nr:hypothetical protein [Saccharothrix deserti]
MHHGGAPPVRDAQARGGGGPLSFTLPATPRTKQGRADFINPRLLTAGQPPLTPDEAYKRVLAELYRRMGLSIAKDLARARPPTTHPGTTGAGALRRAHRPAGRDAR